LKKVKIFMEQEVVLGSQLRRNTFLDGMRGGQKLPERAGNYDRPKSRTQRTKWGAQYGA